tara:strand:- start:403 stop:1173 length:771 start_codon:yes stop_codon:yes gene_type:complete
MAYDFTNQTIIVTGAGSGIGAATAKLFAERGGNVVLVGRRKEKLDEVAADLDASHVLVHATDVSDRAAVEKLIDAAVHRFGGINVLVNNAGVAEMGKFDDFSIEDWNKTIDINVTGVFHMIQAALPHLRKVKGNIVNVSSVSGIGGDWGLAAYNASKGAVTNFTRALALELGRDGIRVNAVNPSLTITDMAAGIAENTEMLAKFKERLPLGKPAQPIDIARVINFLASDEAGFVNGVNLPVDGGLSASNGQPPILG